MEESFGSRTPAILVHSGLQAKRMAVSQEFEVYEKIWKTHIVRFRPLLPGVLNVLRVWVYVQNVLTHVKKNFRIFLRERLVSLRLFRLHLQLGWVSGGGLI